MSTNNVVDRTRSAARGSWGITQFTLMLAGAFAPVYIGVAIAFLVPIGNTVERAEWLVGVTILLIPVAWFIASQPLVLAGRIGTRLLLRSSPRWSKIAAEAVESVIAYVVLILCMRVIFDSFTSCAVGALVAVLLYTLFAPYIERRYEAQREIDTE